MHGQNISFGGWLRCANVVLHKLNCVMKKYLSTALRKVTPSEKSVKHFELKWKVIENFKAQKAPSIETNANMQP